MNRRRIDTLERRLAANNERSCPDCAGRPGIVFVTYLAGHPGDADAQVHTEGGEPQACPSCGWSPRIIEVVRAVSGPRE
jgi:hypothetical protein